MKRPESYTAEIGEQAEHNRPHARGPARRGRSRTWDLQNPVYAFRIRPEDARRLADIAEDLRVSRDALTRRLWNAIARYLKVQFCFVR